MSSSYEHPSGDVKPSSSDHQNVAAAADDDVYQIYPTKLADEERRLIKERRAFWNGDKVLPESVISGLSASGGGIRSATFCLGFAQALAKAEVLRNFDFISSVSGGGYFSSFVGAWIHNAQNARTVEKELPDSNSEPVRFLRNNGRYLAPNGAGDVMAAMASQLRSSLTIWLILGVLALGVFLLGEAGKMAWGMDQWVQSFAKVAAAPCKASTRETLMTYIAWSPAFWCASLCIIALVLPALLAYWFAGSVRRLWFVWVAFFAVVVSLIAPIVLGWWDLPPTGVVVTYLSCVLTLVLGVYAARSEKFSDIARNRLNDVAATTLTLTAVVLVFAVVDTVGQSINRQGIWSAALLPILAMGARGLAPKLTETTKKKMPAWFSVMLVPAGAILVGLIALGSLSMLAHGISHAIWQKVESACPALIVGSVGLASLVFAILLGHSFRFVNLSSGHRLYSARLTRAYIGASNPVRHGKHPKGVPGQLRRDVTAAVEGDRIDYIDYKPHVFGGPLHIINVTVNETIDGISQIEQRDRHGFSMAIGPAGVSVRTKDHALFNHAMTMAQIKPHQDEAFLDGGVATRFHTLAVSNAPTIKAEMPSLGSWVGISGAAFTTGMGARTNLFLSFLLGFFNVRLGYWWNSGVNPVKRVGTAHPKRIGPAFFWNRLFPAQAGLMSEFLAQFHGAGRQHWYLSDGGHFENSGVYEMIRRRVPLIMCCDCGADPKYQFEDLANLTRKARLDFGADIRFWTNQEITNSLPLFSAVAGELNDLRPIKDGLNKGCSSKHVAIASVKYSGTDVESLLIVVKPSFGENAPVDVKHYDCTDRSFPQQSTLDQFFDEAQWESYRAAGYLIGEKMFTAVSATAATHWATLSRAAGGNRALTKQLKPV